jgi:hypothetical protein
MDITPFIQFTLNTRYISRWVVSGLFMYIPVLNFFSLGYLSKTGRMLMIGGIGLPTWQEKSEIWFEGIRLLFVFILYEAIPLFLFSSGFFLTTLSNITAFFGNILIKIAYLGFIVFAFPLPFAFATFAERSDFRQALEYEKIIQAIKEVFVPYLVGFIATLIALYVCKVLIRIPFMIGFLLSSVAGYYVLLIATYYYTELYRKTSLSLERASEGSGNTPSTR